MKMKKYVAITLAAIIGLVQTNILANNQKPLPPDGLYPMTIKSDEKTNDLGEKYIDPVVGLKFKKAIKNEMPSIVDIDDKEEADFYSIKITDTSGQTIPMNNIDKVEGKDTYTLDNINDLPYIKGERLKSGKLYRLEVVPGHWHYTPEGNKYCSPLEESVLNPYKIFITDFDTQIKETDEGLDIIWEYIPGATYEVKYTTDKIKPGQGFEDIINGITITEEEVETFIDPEDSIKYAKYTIEKPVPGTKYSIGVKVVDLDNDYLPEDFRIDFADVEKNDDVRIVQEIYSPWLKIRDVGRDKIELIWDIGPIGDSENIDEIMIYSRVEKGGKPIETKIGTIWGPHDPERFQCLRPDVSTEYQVRFKFMKGDPTETKWVEYIPNELRERPVRPIVPRPYSNTLGVEDGFTPKDYMVKNIGNISDYTEVQEKNTFHTVSKKPIEVQLVWDAPEEYRVKEEKQDTEEKGEEEKAEEKSRLYYDIWVAEDEDMLKDNGTSESTPVGPIVEDLNINKSDKAQLIYADDEETIIGLKTIFTKYTNLNSEQKDIVPNKTYYVKIMAKAKYGEEYEYSDPTIVTITIDKNGDIFAPPVIPKPPLHIIEEETTQTSITIAWLEKWMENNKENSLGENVQYEVKAVDYNDVMKRLKERNESYGESMTLEEFLAEEQGYGKDSWKEIVPVDNDKDNQKWKTHRVTEALSEEKGEGYHELEANNRYVIMLRAFRTLEDGTVLKQIFPSYVIGNTLPEPPPEADPTVPVLNPNGVTDESVSVWWKYNEDFDYEIVYSRSDDPEKAKVWKFPLSNIPGEEGYVSNGARAIVTITGLVPETSYNVWIRAKQKEGDKVSKWSNPVNQTTKSIEQPDPPRGLGPAAYESIVDLGLDFKPIGKDYITIEWLRDVEDIDKDEKSNKTYSYSLEFADNPEFLDSIKVLTGAKEEDSKPQEDDEEEEDKENDYKYEILDKTIVKFSGLEANRPYYVRVRTILTYEDPESDRKIIKESEFTAKVRILTKTSNDEYDGGENDNVVTYPDPIIDSYEDDIWTKEVVDTAKVITQIQESNQYFYTIEMKNYKNRYDAKVRSIVIPKNIIDTLDNKGMALQIVTNIGVYEVPGKALRYQGNSYGARDKVVFDITKLTPNDITLYDRKYPEMFVKGENFAVTIKGENKTSRIKKLDDRMKVKQSLELLGQYNFNNLNAYMYNPNVARWSKQAPVKETIEYTYLMYTTAETGSHLLYQTMQSEGNSSNSYIMNELKAKYNIKGLGDIYKSNDIVNANQYIKLMMGIAKKDPQITLSQVPSKELKTQAKTSGIYISYNTGAVTNEQAIAGVVRLYELNAGYKVKPSKMVIQGISGAYKESVGKAYALGLIDESFKGYKKITYNELCDLVAQVAE